MRLLPLDVKNGSEAGARLGFGCASLGDVLDFSAKCRIVEVAYEAGFRHFDTAPSYAHGEAEAAVAKVLAGVRGQVSIVSKVGIAHPAAMGTMKRLRRFAAPIKALLPAALWAGASRKASRMAAPAGRFAPAQIEASVAETLRRMGSDSVDGLLLHMVSHDDLGPETLATLDGLVASGRVRALGTGTSVEETTRIAQTHPHRFSAFQVDHYWGSRTPALTGQGATLISHRCIRTGLQLLDDPALRREIETHTLARELRAACADKRQVGDLLLRAALQVSAVDVVLVSSSKPERIRRFVSVTRSSGELDSLATAFNDCVDRVAASRAASPAGAQSAVQSALPPATPARPAAPSR